MAVINDPSTGADVINGTTGNDVINLIGGDDTVYLSGVNVDLSGGQDYLNINNINGPVTVKATDAGDNINVINQQGPVNIALGGVEGSLLSNSVAVFGLGGQAGQEGTITISGGNAEDSVAIGETTANASVSLGDGNDYLDLRADHGNVTANMGAGNDTVSSLYYSIGSVNADMGTGQDRVDLYDAAGPVSIKTGDSGDVVKLRDCDGDMTITLGNTASGVSAVSPEDVNNAYLLTGYLANTRVDNLVDIRGYSSASGNMNITGGNGNDAVSIYGHNNYIDTLSMGAGDDSIAITGAQVVSILAGTGNDSVSIDSAVSAQVDLGSGQDKLLAGNTSVTASSADGGDVIAAYCDYNGPASATLTLGSGGGMVDSSQNSLYSGGATKFNNSVEAQYYNTATINGGSGADLITTRLVQNLSLDSGAGDDVIQVYAAGNTTVKAGDGNDTVFVDAYGGQLNVDGGTGNDHINIGGADATVTGGAGCDLISVVSNTPWNPLVAGGADGSQQETLSILMKSTLASGIGARAKIIVDGTQIASQQVDNTTLKEFKFNFDSSLLKAGKVDVVFDNDAFVAATSTTAAQDRNLFVAGGSIRVSDSAALGFQALDASKAIYDRGYGAAATDGKNIYAASKQADGSYGMAWNGALRFQLDTPDTLKGDEIQQNGSGNLLLQRGEGVENFYGGTSRLQLGSDVNFDQLWLSKNSNGEYIAQIIGTADKAVLHGYVDFVSDKSGKTLNQSDFDKLVNAMASMTPPPMGQTTLTADQHTKLDAVLAANWH
jgi:hypothetical protein